jgi:hypothetical protein
LQAIACNDDLRGAGNLYFRAVLNRVQGHDHEQGSAQRHCSYSRCQPFRASWLGSPAGEWSLRRVLPRLKKRSTTRILSSYEFMNYLLVVQVLVRNHSGSVFSAPVILQLHEFVVMFANERCGAWAIGHRPAEPRCR